MLRRPPRSSRPSTPFTDRSLFRSIAWCLWLLFTQRRWLGSRPVAGPVDDTGHVWDEDLTELNNPVPRWWTWMYLLLCLFALGYLVLMPGLGMFQGVLGYTTANEVRRPPAQPAAQVDRQSVVSGKSVSVRVDLGGRSILKKK